MQLKLPGIDNRKNLGAERAADHGNNCAADDEIGEHDEAPSFHQHVCKPIICGAQPIKKGLLRLLVRARAAQHPDREYRHKGAGQQIRPHYRKPDGQGQRHEQIMRGAGHEEGRDEHCENAEHGHESRQCRLGRRLARGPSDTAAIGETGVDVLDRDCRLVDQDADGQCQTTQGHDVDRLTGYPERGHRRQEREWDIQHHDKRAAPIAQKQQHHQACEHDAESALEEQTADGPRHVGGLDSSPVANRKSKRQLPRDRHSPTIKGSLTGEIEQDTGDQ